MRIINDDTKPSIDEALEHYGVLGMKWGVRKDRKATRKAKKSAKKQGKKKRNDDEVKKNMKAGAIFLGSLLAVAGSVAVDNKSRKNQLERQRTQRKSDIDDKYREQVNAAMSYESKHGAGSNWIDSTEGKMEVWNIHRNWDEKSRREGLGGVRR